MIENFTTIQVIFILFILLSNIFSFLLFYIDKRKAVKGSRKRISEKNLLLSSFCVGGIGAFLAMTLIRHKTRKTKFKIAVPIAAIFTLIVIIVIVYNPFM